MPVGVTRGRVPARRKKKGSSPSFSLGQWMNHHKLVPAEVRKASVALVLVHWRDSKFLFPRVAGNIFLLETCPLLSVRLETQSRVDLKDNGEKNSPAGWSFQWYIWSSTTFLLWKEKCLEVRIYTNSWALASSLASWPETKNEKNWKT